MSPRETTLNAFSYSVQTFHLPKHYIATRSQQITREINQLRIGPELKESIQLKAIQISDLIAHLVVYINFIKKECFYLRVLLHEVQYPQSLEDIRRFDGIRYTTFTFTFSLLKFTDDLSGGVI